MPTDESDAEATDPFAQVSTRKKPFDQDLDFNQLFDDFVEAESLRKVHSVGRKRPDRNRHVH